MRSSRLFGTYREARSLHPPLAGRLPRNLLSRSSRSGGRVARTERLGPRASALPPDPPAIRIHRGRWILQRRISCAAETARPASRQPHRWPPIRGRIADCGRPRFCSWRFFWVPCATSSPRARGAPKSARSFAAKSGDMPPPKAATAILRRSSTHTRWMTTSTVPTSTAFLSIQPADGSQRSVSPAATGRARP